RASPALSPRENQNCGAEAKMTSPVHAAASNDRERCRAPSTVNVNRAGTHQTQWCDQEIGEVSRAAKAFRHRARQAWEAARASCIARHASTATAADNASQTAVTAGECGSSPARARTPRMDWLLADCGPPARPTWKTMCVQYRSESRSATTKPRAVTAANDRAV